MYSAYSYTNKNVVLTMIHGYGPYPEGDMFDTSSPISTLHVFSIVIITKMEF